MHSALPHYCQKCRAANRIGERDCRACGTRLMLVVFPPAIRYDEGIVPTYYEDHLLERISLLEIQLAQAMEKIAMISSFFAREAKELKKEQKFVRSVADALKETNSPLAKKLNEKQADGAAAIENGERTPDLQEIVLNHDKPNAPLFSHLLDEGVRLIKSGEEKQAFQMLERAALLSSQNAALFVYIAENYYRADKFSAAKTHLERAFELSPDNETVLLLLGALCADAGDAINARKFLSVLANNQSTTVLIYFIWGMLAASEENWIESLAAFKQAAESVEMDFLIGCVYFQLKNYERALEYFQKAVAADFKFSDAWFMQSLVYKTRGDTGAGDALAAKAEADAHSLEYLTGGKSSDDKTAPPFRHFKTARKNFLTGGAPRLSRFFREQILKALEQKNK